MKRSIFRALVALSATALPGFAQNALYQPPLPTTGENLDNFRANWVNLELNTQDVMSLDTFVGHYLLVPNIPESEVKVFYTPSMTIINTIPIPPATTAIAVMPSSEQAVGIETGRGTLFVIDFAEATICESVDIGGRATGMLIHPSGDRVYVSCMESEEVAVVETATWTVAQRISTRGLNPTSGDVEFYSPAPVAMSFDAGRNQLHVLSQFSGNNSSAAGPLRKGDFPVDDSGADLDCVANLDELVDAITALGVPASSNSTGLINPLLDDDLLVIQAGATPGSASVLSSMTQKRLGAMNFDVAYEPSDDTLWVLSQHARNAEFNDGNPFPNGDVVRNEITIIDASQPPCAPGAPCSSRTVIDVDALANANGVPSFAQMTDVAFDSASDRAYVASYGGDRVLVFDTTNGTSPSYVGCYFVKPVSGGPSTRSGPRRVFADGKDLYIFNKADNSMAVVDTVAFPAVPSGTNLPSMSLGYDPTPADVKAGRGHMINAEFSANGSSSCASCHFDGGLDELTWELSSWWDKNPAPGPTTPPSQHHTGPLFEKDFKGPMVTQSLRGLPGAGRLHWRGEREQFTDFNGGAFAELFKFANGIPPSDMIDFQTYVHSLPYLPNSRQQLDRSYSQNPIGNAHDGLETFLNDPAIGIIDPATGVGRSCASCHSLPFGTNAEVQRLDAVGVLAPSTKVAQLRGVQDKLTNFIHDTGDVFGDRSAVGSGLAHNGAAADLLEFVESGVFTMDQTQEANLVAFLKELDTGLAPSTSYVKTIKAANVGSLADTLAFVDGEALAGNASFAVYSTETLPGGAKKPAELFYMPSDPVAGTPGYLQSKFSLYTLPLNDIETYVHGGGCITFVGFPAGMAWRASVDSDCDGILDADEFGFGTSATVYDSDGDGFSDGHEIVNPMMSPTLVNASSTDGTNPGIVGGVHQVLSTTESVKLEFATTEPARVTAVTQSAEPVNFLILGDRGASELSVIHQIMLVDLNPLNPPTAVDLTVTDEAGLSFTLTNVPISTKVPLHSAFVRVHSISFGTYLPTGGLGGSIPVAFTLQDEGGGITGGPPYKLKVFLHYDDNSGTPQAQYDFDVLVDGFGQATVSIPLPVTTSGAIPTGRTIRVGVRDVEDPSGGRPYLEAFDTRTVTGSGLDFQNAQEITF